MQMSFLPSDEQNPFIKAVEESCQKSAPAIAEILIEMAKGIREIDKEQRIACVEVLRIASGERFRGKGRPSQNPVSDYKSLLNGLNNREKNDGNSE